MRLKKELNITNLEYYVFSDLSQTQKWPKGMKYVCVHFLGGKIHEMIRTGLKKGEGLHTSGSS